MAILFESIRWKNFLSTGNSFSELSLNQSPTTLIIGNNGSGKCVHRSTLVDISFSDKKSERQFKNFLKKKEKLKK